MNYKLIILLLIFFIILTIYFYQKNTKIEKFMNNENQITNNYIINGSFMDEKPIYNSSLIGNSNIIKFENNPGLSHYVLECKKNRNTGIKININNMNINDTYKFSFYYNSSGSINISNYIKFNIINNNNQTIYLSQKFYENKEPYIINNTKWYYVSSLITIPENTNIEKNLNIHYLNTSSLPVNTIYSTDFKFFKILNDDENYELTNGLKTLLLTKSLEKTSKKWIDFSGYHNDFYFNPNIPIINKDKKIGGVSLNNNKLIGPNCNKVFGNNPKEFSIVFSIYNYQENNKNTIIDEEYTEEELISGELTSEENINDYLFLSIPGNQDYILKVFIKPDIGYISIYANDGKINLFRNNMVFNKSILSITFKNDTLNLYQNGVLINSIDCDNSIFYSSSEKNIILNENKNLNVYMNYFAIYNNALINDDYNTIDDYFKGYFNQQNNHYIIIKPSNNNKDNDDNNDNEDNDDLKQKCKNDCNDLCKDDEICKNNYCKYINNCVQYCKNNKKDDICKDNLNQLKCPTVYTKNGNYYVYIPEHSEYNVKKGEIYYGSIRQKARKLYELNFPKCPIPDILKYPGGIHPLKKCPYLVNNNTNPCNGPECADIDWSLGPYQQNISKECKQKISNYCRLYHDIDPINCKCWTDKHKESSQCYHHRRYFEDPNDYQCCIKSFNINEHPDFNKYVKKDKVPCYGCKL
jgi:hypothetical protein